MSAAGFIDFSAKRLFYAGDTWMNWPLMKPRLVDLVWPCLACILLCTIVNLLYFPHATIFPDEQRFLNSATRLAASGEFWVGRDRAWEMPGTALFFTPFVRLWGPHAAILPIRFAQTILLALQCALIAVTARRLFPDKRTAALIAAWIVTVYPFFLYYQGLLLSETLFDTLMLAGIAALFWWRERGMRIDAAFVAACFCFAAATYVKSTLTVLPPLLLAASAWLMGATWRRASAILAVALCLYGAFMSPWWIRNAVLFHAFVPFGTNAGGNLYLGNNPHNRDAGIDWASDVEPDFVAKMQVIPDELARERAFSKQATDYITAHPGDFLYAASRKFIRFWNVVPNVAEYRKPLYSLISALSFGPILVFAVAGVVRMRRQWRQFAPLYLIIGYFTILHVVTVSSLRYRLPIEALLILLAAEPLAAGAQWIGRRAAFSRPAKQRS
jgi:4-amino-4-deoxy-L-arabinose transferase-like glycosyltransferase